MNHISTAIGLTIIGYVLFALVASSPSDRIDRVCNPAFVWPEKALVSGAKIFAPSAVNDINKSFGSGRARCRAWVWGVFYEDEYRALLKKTNEAAKK